MHKRINPLSVSLVCFLALSFLAAGSAFAFSSIKTQFNNIYGTAGTKLDTCTTCHTSGYGFNPYAQDLRANNINFQAIEGLDSDGDGYVNSDEIAARTFPGDAGDVPAVIGPVCTDSDGDGFAVEGGECGEVDCDDNNPDVKPGAVENCTDGIDNNCNGKVDTQDPAAVNCPPVCTDKDGDGYAVEGGACGEVDCDDANSAVNPGAVESCTDGIDNNCDNLIDDADPKAVNCPVVVPPAPTCTDADGDGFAIEGGVCGPVDCNDGDPAVNPHAVEGCTDGVDNNCDGLVDTADPTAVNCPAACTDADEDGYAIEGGECGPVDCNDSDPAINPGAAEDCTDGLDNNCNDQIDAADPTAVGCPPVCTDADKDGFAIEGGACGPVDTNDNDPAVFPGSDTTPVDPIPTPVPADGTQLYGDNCAACHGGLNSSEVRGSSSSAIQAAIDGNRGGMGFLNALGAEEVQAIADALSDPVIVQPPVIEPPTTGDDDSGYGDDDSESDNGPQTFVPKGWLKGKGNKHRLDN